MCSGSCYANKVFAIRMEKSRTKRITRPGFGEEEMEWDLVFLIFSSPFFYLRLRWICRTGWLPSDEEINGTGSTDELDETRAAHKVEWLLFLCQVINSIEDFFSRFNHENSNRFHFQLILCKLKTILFNFPSIDENKIKPEKKNYGVFL